jgi:hypothetical protein
VRVALVVGIVAAALTAGSAASAATPTHECDGLQICVPVAGPWVVVPTGSVSGKAVEYQLDCPRGYVVGGLDAELTSNAIDLTFAGAVGSPVNPGITTGRSAVFTGTYVGLDTRATATFRPHIGCIPASGGGGRVPTSVTTIVRPGQPTVRRVQTVRVPVGASRVTSACASGERLIAASHAVGFYTLTPPGRRLVEAVRTAASVRGSRAVVSVQGGKALATVRAVVQVGVVCAGGK